MAERRACSRAAASSTRRGERARRRASSRRRARSSRSAPDLDARRDVLDAGGLRRRARPRRPPRPPPRAGPRGGRDDRDRRRAPRRSAASPRSSPCRTPSPPIDDAAVVREVLDLGARRAVRRARRRRDHRRAARGEQLAPMAEMADLGVRIFTDDGDGVQDDRLMRRALEYAAGLGVDARAALRGRGARRAAATCTRASGRAGSASRASPAEAEELMVDRATSRSPGSPARRSTSSTSRPPARSRWCARPRPTALPVTAEATPHHFTLTDACVRRLRPGVQGEPAAAHRRRRRRGAGRARRRHHRRHRHRPRAAHARRPRSSPFDEAPPGMLGLETALALALTELSSRACSARGGARRCCRGSRRAIAGLDAARTAARSRPGDPRTSA